MKRYKEVHGDLLKMFKDRHFNAIAHGCNCMKMMTGGIALQIANQFPQAKYVDSSTVASQWKIGQMTSVDTRYGVIYNLYTQVEPGKDFRLHALEVALEGLNNEVPFLRKKFFRPKLGLPMIGCGIGGGDWKQVKKVIQEKLTNWDVTVVIYKAED